MRSRFPKDLAIDNKNQNQRRCARKHPPRKEAAPVGDILHFLKVYRYFVSTGRVILILAFLLAATQVVIRVAALLPAMILTLVAITHATFLWRGVPWRLPEPQAELALLHSS